MITFWNWVLRESRQRVEPAVLGAYERAFKDEVARLLQRTTDPVLRRHLLTMLDCPVRDRRGNCRDFTEYIHAALIKNGIQAEYDLEAAMGYVIQKMLMGRSEATGEPRAGLFSGFSPRPADTPDFNPLQARFMAFLDGERAALPRQFFPELGGKRRQVCENQASLIVQWQPFNGGVLIRSCSAATSALAAYSARAAA